MSKKPHYYLDSDVFIAAKNAYFAFSICPGFWKSLLHYHGQNRRSSIDQIRREILAGRDTDDLVHWTRKEAPADFFWGKESKDVVDAFTEVMPWAQRNSHYLDILPFENTRFGNGIACAQNRIRLENSLPKEQTKVYLAIRQAFQRPAIDLLVCSG